MKVLKFKNPRSFSLELLKDFGNNYFEIYQTDCKNSVPQISLSINELNIFKVTDVPARKMLYVHFVETVSPLIIYAGEEYEKLESINREDVYKKALEIINSMSDLEFSKLFSLKMQDGIRMKQEEFEKIEIDSDFTCFVPAFIFYEEPKVPILPPMKTI